MEKFLAIETSRAPYTHVILPSGSQMSQVEMFCGLGRSGCWSSKLSQPKLSGVSDLWLDLSWGNTMSVPFLFLSRGCLWVVPSFTWAYILWQVLTQFRYLNVWYSRSWVYMHQSNTTALRYNAAPEEEIQLYAASEGLATSCLLLSIWSFFCHFSGRKASGNDLASHWQKRAEI